MVIYEFFEELTKETKDIMNNYFIMHKLWRIKEVLVFAVNSVGLSLVSDASPWTA